MGERWRKAQATLRWPRGLSSRRKHENLGAWNSFPHRWHLTATNAMREIAKSLWLTDLNLHDSCVVRPTCWS